MERVKRCDSQRRYLPRKLIGYIRVATRARSDSVRRSLDDSSSSTAFAAERTKPYHADARTQVRKRLTAMAHKVTFNLPKRELGREDIVFVVEKNERRFGTLLISKGAVEWRPTNKQYRRKISWDKFDQLMREIGNRV